jgi:hypothetical protein
MGVLAGLADAGLITLRADYLANGLAGALHHNISACHHRNHPTSAANVTHSRGSSRRPRRYN